MWFTVRTKAKATSTSSIFNKLIAWLSLAGVALILGSSIWTYYNTNKLIQITQERREIALGKGLALAISDLIVTREYAQLESDLRQIMGNEAVKSVMVTDLEGVVLAYLERKTISGEVVSNFRVTGVDLSKNLKEQFLIERKNDLSILWYKIDPGIPLGWIRMETFLDLEDAILNGFRFNIIFSVLILFLGVFGVTILLFLRARKKSQENELRLLASNEILQDVAHHDVLTKLPNRLALENLLINAISTRSASDLLAICFLDLDGFKGVNDRMGHRSGDNLLIAASGRMKKAVRERDSVIRLGGDEFVLILGGIQNHEQLEQMLSRILELLAAPFMIDGENVSITASCGVTVYPWDNSTISDLLKNADEAMYKAKAKGKNAWEIYTGTKVIRK